VPSKDLTWRLFGEDVSASRAFRKLSDDVRDSMDKSTREVDKFDGRVKQTASKGSGPSLLISAIAGIAPAAAPLAGVAAGLGVAFAGMGVTALLGFKGIQEQMKAGTTIGRQYRGGMESLTNEFAKLKTIAAAGLLSGFQASIKAVQPLFPLLNHDVATFSSQIGAAGSHLIPGLVSVIGQLNPLFVTFGNEMVRGAASFQRWASSSDAVARFVAYVQTNLPNVEQTVGALITTVSHLVQGLAGFGGTSLTGIKLLSQAINAIPVGALQALLPLVAGLALGMKGLAPAANAATALGNFAAKAADAGGMAGRASGFVGTLGKTVGFLGPIGVAAGIALGGLAAILGRHQQAAQADTAATANYTAALLASNLAVDQSVRAVAAKQLAEQGAYDSAKRLSISQTDLTSAVLGVGTSMDTVKQRIAEGSATLDGYRQQALASGKTLGELGLAGKAKQLESDLGSLSGVVQSQAKDFAASSKAAADQSAAVKGVSASAQQATAETAKQAAAVGLSVDEYLAFSSAAKAAKGSTDEQAQAMQRATLAAQSLQVQMDLLNNADLNVTDANVAFRSALLGVTSSMQTNGNTMSQNTKEGIANNQAVSSAIHAAEAHGQAVAKQTNSTARGTQAILADLAALRSQIVAVHGNTSAIDAMTRSIKGVPEKKTTVFKSETTDAEGRIHHYQTTVDQLRGRTVTITTNVDTGQAARTISNFVNTPRFAYVQVQTVAPGNATAPAFISGGRQLLGARGLTVPSFAGGGHTVMVGEQGPEYVSLPANSRVHTATETRRALAGSGGMTVNIHVNSPLGTPEQIAREVVPALDKYYNNGGRSNWPGLRTS